MRIGRIVLSVFLAAGQIVAMMPVAHASNTSDGGVVVSQMYPGTASGESKDEEFVELYNNTDTPVDITNWCVEYLAASGNKQWSVCLDAPDTATRLVLAPYGYATFVSNTLKSAWPIKADAYFVGIINQAKGFVRVVDGNGIEQDKLGWGDVTDQAYHGAFPKDMLTSGNVLQRKQVSSVMQDTDDDAADFISVSLPLTIHASNVYEEEVVAPPTQVTDCTGVVINEIGANTTSQFVELYNTTDASVQLAGCKLQTNRNSKTYTLTQTSVGPGEYVVVNIADTGLTLTKTTTGTVYLLSSDGLTENDAVNYSNLLKDTSWARFVDGWRQTYAMTPGTDNIDQAYPPCADGYYRNLATGRCNVIPVDAPLAVCAADQFRNPETGRCKKIVTATVTPCKDNQYRSEETNRCRNIVTASTKKPCKDNQYRSEETNRCRNLPVKTVPDAVFAVQPVPDTGNAFVGWWALGGVVLLALGYAVWEWRYEISRFAESIASKFSAKQ